VSFIGNQSHNLSYSQILKLPSITGSGKILKTNGSIIGPFNYTGVDISAISGFLVNTSQNFSIEVFAENGSKVTFSKDQLYGNIPLYNQDGAVIGHGGPNNLTLVLVYHEGGERMTEARGGPFRMAYLGEFVPITDAYLWISNVNKIIVSSGLTERSITFSG
jgi:hypothetical protein